MKPAAFRLLAMTALGSAGLAVLTAHLTGSLLLAFLTYSLGGALLMMGLAVVMVWRMNRRLDAAGAGLAEWERDTAEEKRQSGSGADANKRKAG